MEKMRYLIEKNSAGVFTLRVTGDSYDAETVAVRHIDVYELAQAVSKITDEAERVTKRNKIIADALKSPREAYEQIQERASVALAHFAHSTKPFAATFHTGEMLSVRLNTGVKMFSYGSRTVYKQCELHLMPESYPVFWNMPVSYAKEFTFYNTDYALYITEVSPLPTDANLWKLELIMTRVENDIQRYFLGGRFKFMVRVGDELRFRYYKDSRFYVTTAKVQQIGNNAVTFAFQDGLYAPVVFEN